jgi:hypothetical protein
MKKLTLLIALLLSFLMCTAGNITQTYHFGNPVINTIEDYQAVTFENTLLTGKTGEPALPYREVRLLLPPGEEAVTVNIHFENPVELEGFYNIYPQQASRPLSSGPSMLFSYNENVYNSSEDYPSHQMGHYSTHFQNGHSILLTAFTPVKYIPATGKLSYYRTVTVEVITQQTNRASEALENLGSAPFVASILSSVQNPEVIDRYPVKRNREGDYQVLVITRQQFEDEFEEYRMLYLIRGMKTEVVTVEDIDAVMGGSDLQEKIRNYIIQEYQENSIVHVLLAGDVEHVPYRGFYCYVDSGSGYSDNDIPADLYYSALDGTWNEDGDNSWGEIGEDDLLPDISVARWPFSTLEQLQRLIYKTKQYQNSPVTGELQRPLLAGEHLWSNPETWGGDYMDLLIGHHEDNGYTTDGIPETDDFLQLYERDDNWSKWDLINAVNQGRNFIHHCGHANQSNVMKLGIYDITNQNFNQTDGTTHNYTLVYTHGCLCGAFDENDCIAEAMVMIDNFAVAGAFNSRYGWFNEGQTEGPSQHLHREFVDALYHQMENRIGTTHLISKVNTSPWVNAPGQWEEGALRWCFYDCNILGDPLLGVWTQEPINIEVESSDIINQGQTTYSVYVNNGGMPIQGLTCVLIAEEEMIGCSSTGSNGQATIEIPGGFDGAEAELVVSGYHCLPHFFPLNVQVGLEPLQPAVSINVFPVPCEDHLRVELYAENSTNSEVSIFLPDGRLISQYKMELKPGSNSMVLNSSEWPEGVVLLKVSGGQLDVIKKVVHY